MRDPSTDQNAVPRNTSLNEDLGRVGICFCDKTGTLTANIMRLRWLVTPNKVYGGEEIQVRGVLYIRTPNFVFGVNTGLIHPSPLYLGP